jgi:DNA primase large subunit
MPYSLHPAQWLVSLPIKIDSLKSFRIEDAKPEKVKANTEFLVNKEGEATELLLQAFDWKSKQPKEVIKETLIRPRYTKVVSEEYFPPCINAIINGLKDGKKRSLFTLITYLRNMNWSQEDVEKKIAEWNMKNSSSPTPINSTIMP